MTGEQVGCLTSVARAAGCAFDWSHTTGATITAGAIIHADVNTGVGAAHRVHSAALANLPAGGSFDCRVRVEFQQIRSNGTVVDRFVLAK